MRNAKRMDNYELDQMLVDRNNFRKEFSKRWQEWGISAIVSPAFPTCAFNAKDAQDMGIMLDYTFLWNSLCYPSGIVPVTTIQKDEQSYEDGINDGWTKLLKGTVEKSEGMPICV